MVCIHQERARLARPIRNQDQSMRSRIPSPSRNRGHQVRGRRLACRELRDTPVTSFPGDTLHTTEQYMASGCFKKKLCIFTSIVAVVEVYSRDPMPPASVLAAQFTHIPVACL